MRILVVCGAGASSTFVAQRLRQAAVSSGRDWETAAGTERTIASNAADLLLIGPHLADRLPTIRETMRAPVAVLPEDIFSDRDGLRTLAIADAALSEWASRADATRSANSHSPAKGTP